MNKEQFLKKISKSLNENMVTINGEKINELVITTNQDIGQDEPLPNNVNKPQDAIWFALVFNSINHQFWDVKNNEFVRYQHNGSVGALAMQKHLKEFIEKYESMEFIQKNITFDEKKVKEIFGEMPDPKQRAEILNQSFSESGSKCAELLIHSLNKKNTWSLAEAEMIEASLPLGYQDEFLKKAQLCLYVAANYIKKFGSAPEVLTTCFADYQVPKVLNGLGIIEYSQDIQNKINNKQLISKDSPEEKAIRAATIIACEKISEQYKISAPDLDYWLWLKRNDYKAPFHLTKTVCY